MNFVYFILNGKADNILITISTYIKAPKLLVSTMVTIKTLNFNLGNKGAGNFRKKPNMSAPQSQSKPTLDAAQSRLIAEALQITRYLTSGSNHPKFQQRQQQRLHTLQDALQAFAHPIRREACPVNTIPIKVRQAFVEAVALLKHYNELGGAVWQGTISSATLSQYQAKAAPTELFTELAIANLCQQFQLPNEFQAEITAKLATNGQLQGSSAKADHSNGSHR